MLPSNIFKSKTYTSIMLSSNCMYFQAVFIFHNEPASFLAVMKAAFLQKKTKRMKRLAAAKEISMYVLVVSLQLDCIFCVKRIILSGKDYLCFTPNWFW